MYDDVISQINQKIALKDAMSRANNAIASSKQGSRRGNDDESHVSVFSQPKSYVNRQPVGEDIRSKTSNNSRLSLVAISQRGKWKEIYLHYFIK